MGVQVDTGYAQRLTRRHALLEVAAMFALLLSYIWGWQGEFPGSSPLIILSYLGLGVSSHVRRGESAHEVGLRIDNWRPALRDAALVVAIAAAAALAIGAVLGSWHFPSAARTLNQLPWLLVWGTAQQYGLVCFFYRRFLDVFAGVQAATAATAVTFAIFHAPNPFLMVVTLLSGVVSCVLYRRQPNVFVLGLAHAVISFLIYSSLPYQLTGGFRVGPGYLALG